MLWSQRSVVLVAVLSAVIFSTLIAARSSYDGKDLGARKYYNKQHGNYYPNPRQEVSIPFARPPSLLETVINAIKRLLLVPDRIRRQGFVGALSGLAPVAVAGVATAGVFRNEIADIVQDFANPTTTTTTAATTTANPCKGVTCASGKKAVANLGICQCLECSANSDCTGTTSNQCVGGQCKCGTSDKCTSVTPFCGKTSAKTTSATASDGNSAACYCSVSSKSCTGATANFCDSSDGVCKCGTTGAACKSTDGTPYCVHHKNVKVNGVDTISTQASVQDNSGEPKCSCYVDTKSGQYVCGDTSLTACVIKSCLTAKPICCGDKSKNPGIKYSCKAASSECKK